jgi:hypothetical protein
MAVRTFARRTSPKLPHAESLSRHAQASGALWSSFPNNPRNPLGCGEMAELEQL